VRIHYGVLVAAASLLIGGKAWAERGDELGDSIRQALEQAQHEGAHAPDDSSELSSKDESGGSGCKIPEVDDSKLNDLFSKKTVLVVYDSLQSCPVLEKLSGTYKDRVAFAKVSYKRFHDLGIKDRIGEKGTPTLNHYYLLDGTPAKFDFDSASPAGTKYAGVAYGMEEYVRATLWRCLNAAPSDPAPATMPVRVQCLPECPHRETGWVCQTGN
jgi:hypothetical protein